MCESDEQNHDDDEEYGEQGSRRQDSTVIISLQMHEDGCNAHTFDNPNRDQNKDHRSHTNRISHRESEGDSNDFNRSENHQDPEIETVSIKSQNFVMVMSMLAHLSYLR